jgi:hypothetical protein
MSKNRKIAIKPGQIWVDDKGTPKYKVLCKGWKVGYWSLLNIDNGRSFESLATGLPINYNLAEESIIDIIFEKYDGIYDA